MFRFSARFTPNMNAQACFKAGASSVNYFGKDVSRRSFLRQNTPVVKGFIDTSKILSSVPCSAFASLWCLEQAAAGGMIQLGSEDALNGILGSVLASTATRLGASCVSDCATTLSRTLLSNAMAMQWTLCCKAMLLTVDSSHHLSYYEGM